MTWENAPAANGPKVADWIERHFPGRGHEIAGKQWGRWRNGGQAAFQTLDRVLVRLDVHPSQLPVDVWERWKPRKRKGMT